jgi:predicted CXXCH cytochrome family protein
MQRLPSLLSALVALASMTALAGPRDVVYLETRHGQADGGVNRTPAVPVGHCRQCHDTRTLPQPQPHLLFRANDNTLCVTCHAGAGAASYLGATVYDGGAHWGSAKALWPGPSPAARPPGDEGLCLTCHTPHGTRDGQGLVPSLGLVREEALCLACHDGSGPASTNMAAELAKAAAHPVVATSGVHEAREPLVPATFGAGRRHAECVDCHNPHAASDAARLAGVPRVAVTNGAAGAVPAYALLAATDATPVQEYQLCFKCHASWTTQPAGQDDLALGLNPANESFHPVEAPGKGTSTQLAASLAGGSGLPHLTTSDTITCSDCHGSEALPLTVSKVSAYTGAVPTGPHGSNAAAANAAYSKALLRASYRVTPKTGGGFVAAEAQLCLICHKAAPFQDTSKNTRTDTRFNLHGFHLGKGTLCAECHANPHGTRLAPVAANRTYARLVSFAPNVTGATAGASPTWNGSSSCSLRCHGTTHNPETYP